MKKTQTIKGKVVKAGRKYLHIVQEGKTEKYPEQLIINDYVEKLSLKIGNEFELFVETEIEQQYRGYKVTHAAFDEAQYKDNAHKAEISRWYGYIITTYENDGYIYNNGVEKLHELNCHKYDDEIAEMKKDIEIKKAIYWIRRNWKEESKIYEKGIQTLKRHGCTKYDEEIIKMENEYNKIHDVFFFDMEYGYFKRNETFAKNGRYWKVLSCSKIMDGFSFGCKNDECLQVECIDISGSEEAKEYFEKRKKEIVKDNEIAVIKMEINKRRKEIIDKIKENDVLKDEKSSIIGTIDIYNTRNIYGSGETICHNDENIWYVIINSMDGDDWSRNNIDGDGIGYMAEYTNELKSLVKNYQETCCQINK